jgi:hypothetical protein
MQRCAVQELLNRLDQFVARIVLQLCKWSVCQGTLSRIAGQELASPRCCYSKDQPARVHRHSATQRHTTRRRNQRAVRGSYDPVSRSGKIALWAAAGLAVVLLVFLIAIAVGQGLGQAGLWATVLGLPVGVIGAVAAVLALVIKPSNDQPSTDPGPSDQQHPKPRSTSATTLVRLAVVGVREHSLDAWALHKDGIVRHWWWPRGDGSPGWSDPALFRALPDEAGPITDIAAGSRGRGHAEIFALDKRGRLWGRPWLQGEGWAEWHQLTSNVAGPLTACSLRDGHIQVLVTDQDHQTVRHSYSPAADGWRPWTALDALNGSDAPLVRLTAVGVRGKWLDAWTLRADGKLRHSFWPREDGERTWNEWEDFAAPVGTVDVAAASRGPRHAVVFALDRNGDLWHRSWDQNQSWENWQRFPLTGCMAPPLAACSLKDGDLRLFATDPETDEVMYSTSSVPASWDAWERLNSQH